MWQERSLVENIQPVFIGLHAVEAKFGLQFSLHMFMLIESCKLRMF